MTLSKRFHATPISNQDTVVIGRVCVAIRTSCDMIMRIESPRVVLQRVL